MLKGRGGKKAAGGADKPGAAGQQVGDCYIVVFLYAYIGTS